MLFVCYKIPFQPKKFKDFASQLKAKAIISNNLPRIDNGHVPNNTIKTIIKIASIIFFIELNPMQQVFLQLLLQVFQQILVLAQT